MSQELVNNLKDLKTKIKTTWQFLDLNTSQTRLKVLEAQMNESEFWQNQNQAKQVAKEHEDLKSELATWQKISQEVDDNLELAKLGEDTSKEYEKLSKQFQDLEFYILFSGPHDKESALVAIHAGAGGVDAQDWAAMLQRMILRYSERHNFTSKLLEISYGQEAGIKKAVYQISGRYAYGQLKSENGVHRLVRISPFDAEAMRHTSFALIEVLPDFGELPDIKIEEKDLKVDVFRSSGPGGQSVNTTDSAVRLTHMPTGIVVSCQNEKSQHQNKETALKILKNKLHLLAETEREEEKRQIRGEYTSAEWGNQARSYVLHPYKMVKDHRTDYEEGDPQAVLDGNLDSFIESYLRQK